MVSLETNIKKKQVHDFWNNASCGEDLYLTDNTGEGYLAHVKKRYELEPFIKDFAEFDLYNNKDVLEIGVGLGADHQQFAQEGARLKGIDLTDRAVKHTTQRLKLFGLESDLKTGDAENLPYPDNSFDLVYSWGVLHHSPDTQKAILEVCRVLKKGGEAKIMIYHKYSLVGYMLWLRYALLRLNPFTSLAEIYSNHLESPGTKAYSVKDAANLFSCFEHTKIETLLGHGDLLTSAAGQRHRGIGLSIARIIWPRWLFKTFMKSQGLFMLIKAQK